MIEKLAFALCSIGLSTCSAAGPETGAIHAEDGVRISYTSEGQGEPAIVFIHGWTCDHTHWRLQVPEFRKSNRVITIDLPGHGASGANRKSWSIEGLGADVAVVVRSLELKQVFLVGHSMGGRVAVSAAGRLRGIVRGVVAVDSLQNVEFTAPADVADRMAKRFEDDFDAAWTRFMSEFFSDRDSDILKWILAKSDGFDRKAAVSLWAAYNRFDGKAALAAAGVPVRAINAADAYPTAVEVNRKYGDFDAILMSGVGHFLMLEKPVEFNRHLRHLIDQIQKNKP